MKSFEPFMLRPEYRNVPKGEAYRSETLRSSRRVLWVLVIVDAFLVWLVIGALGKCFTSVQLQWFGEETAARVLAVRCDNDSEHPSWFVRYDVEGVAGSEHEEEITRGYARQLSVGGHVPVIYLPNEPAVSRVTEDNTWKMFLAQEVIFWLVVASIVLFFVIRQGREVRLWRDGTILQGQLLTCIGEVDDHGFSIRTTYGFVSPEGHILSGRLTVPREDLHNKPLPGPETKVAVLYLNSHHFQVL